MLANWITKIDEMHADMRRRNERLPGMQLIASSEPDLRVHVFRTTVWSLTAVVCSLILALCSSCAVPKVIGQTRGPVTQGALSARVEVACVQGDMTKGRFAVAFKYGSATMLSGVDALTARHVVDCESNARVVAVVSTMPDGTEKRTVAEVAAEDPAHDVARLKLRASVGDVRAPALGAVKLGDEVCMLWDAPLPRGRRCGRVLRREDDAGDTVHDAPAMPGNSGGGVYDRAGRLVGVTINRHWCTPLDALADLIEPGTGKICGSGMSTNFRGVL